MTANSRPANTDTSLLPVEHRLPLPDDNATTLIRLITEPLDKSAKDNKGELVKESVWILGRAHPLAGAKIVRMYHREDGGVDVYSSDGGMCVRTFVPERVIRFLDETMSEDTFVAFIEEAETEPEEEPEEEEEEEEVEPEDTAPAPGPAPGPTPDPVDATETEPKA